MHLPFLLLFLYFFKYIFLNLHDAKALKSFILSFFPIKCVAVFAKERKAKTKQKQKKNENGKGEETINITSQQALLCSCCFFFLLFFYGRFLTPAH